MTFEEWWNGREPLPIRKEEARAAWHAGRETAREFVAAYPDAAWWQADNETTEAAEETIRSIHAAEEWLKVGPP